MPSKEELFREAKDIHTEYAKCSSTSRRAELKRRYEEINCQLNKFTSNESAPNSSLMLNKNSVREPNIVSQQQNGTEVLEGFPKRENVPDSKHYNAEWKRYLLPLILVVASALTVGMWLWSQHKPIIDNLPTEENRSDKERAKTANELVSEGDSLWEEGFKGLNDKTLLNDAYVYYKNAWKELTGEDWQYKNIKGNKDVKVLVEAVQSAVLKDKLIYRIDVLEKKLDGFSLW